MVFASDLHLPVRSPFIRSEFKRRQKMAQKEKEMAEKKVSMQFHGAPLIETAATCAFPLQSVVPSKRERSGR